MDYHDAMMPLHGFVYTRALIFILGTLGPTTSFLVNVNSPFVYAEAVFGAALISVSHCSKSWAVMEYMSVVFIIGKLSLWTAVESQNSRYYSKTSLYVAFILANMVQFQPGIVPDGSWP